MLAGSQSFVRGYASPWRPKPAYRYTVEDTVYLSPGCTGRGIGRWVDTALMQKDLGPAGVTC